MSLSSSKKRRISARARTLDERLHSPGDVPLSSDGSSPGDSPLDNDSAPSGDPEVSDEDGDEWLEQWKSYVSDGDSNAFESRLDFDDYSADECRRRLHTRGVSAEEPLPEWVGTLEELVEYVESRESGESSRLIEANEDTVFVHVLAPFVEFAADRVEWDSVANYLSEPAKLELERWLLDRLVKLSSHTLFIEFKTFVASHDHELAVADDPEMPDSPRRYYDQFVAEMHEGELSSLFEEYATLARVVVTLLDQWCDAVGTFCTRLHDDRDRLADAFGVETALGEVTDLDYHGDHHQGGRLVFHLTFESGLELAYKPRDIRSEARFADLISWMNAEFDGLDLRALDCLTRPDYGWMRWVEATSCSTSDGIERYYRRAGSLLCLLYALNFTDGHLENVVGAGEYPVVVDLETIMHPDLPPGSLPATGELPGMERETVLRTGLLPKDTSKDELQDLAGFGAACGQRTGVQIPTFDRVNTDVMELEYEDSVSIPGESLPQFDGSTVEPREHSDTLADGFTETYRFLLDHKAELLADDGPIAAFSDTEVRLVYRQTKTYDSILTPLTTPGYLRTGQQFGCKIERLTRPFAEDDADAEMWPMYEAERTALWRADVPRFSMRADDTSVLHDHNPVVDVLDDTPLEQARNRIEHLSELDLEKQLGLIELAYQQGTGSPPDFSPIPDSVEAASATDFQQYPRAIFERLEETATRTSDGTPLWHYHEGSVSGVSLEPVDDGLYRGRLGTAVFCAALATTTGEEQYRDFATRVGKSVVGKLDGEDVFPDLEIGGGVGIGSLVYGLTVLGDLLDDEEFTEAARRGAELVTPDRFGGDADVMSGTAGAVLALLALYDRTGDDELLEKASAGGEQLLADRVNVDGRRVWYTTAGEQVLAGMAHGVAGIAYALARLSAATGDERFCEAAVEALGYEETAYSAEKQNWRDYRPDAVAEYVTDWCGGRAGIGLSRLGMYETTGDETFLEDVERALDGTDGTALEDLDHLCCGNFSRVDFLLEAGRQLDAPEYVEQARLLATATVQRADENGQFTVPGQTNHWFNPSLFRGEPGIGYTLLRLGESDLPCVTRWE